MNSNQCTVRLLRNLHLFTNKNTLRSHTILLCLTSTRGGSLVTHKLLFCNNSVIMDHKDFR